MSRWRIAIFEFLALPGILWVKLAALCVRFRWVMLRQEQQGDDEDEVMLRQEEDDEDKPPNCDHVPQHIRNRKDGDRR